MLMVVIDCSLALGVIRVFMMHPSITQRLPLSAPAGLLLFLPLTTELIVRWICRHLFGMCRSVHRPSLWCTLRAFPSLMAIVLLCVILSLHVERPEKVICYLIKEVMIVKHGLNNN